MSAAKKPQLREPQQGLAVPRRRLANVVDEPEIHATWEYWRVTQSEFHYRAAGTVDLGCIDDD